MSIEDDVALLKGRATDFSIAAIIGAAAAKIASPKLEGETFFRWKLSYLYGNESKNKVKFSLVLSHL